MTPSGYEDGKLFSELPTDGSGDFTFSRGSNLAATRVGPTGLIEKGRENLLLQSNQFDTTWATSNASLTSGQSGYDGSSDAWLLTATTSPALAYQTISGTSIYSFSLYAKANTQNAVFIRLTGSVSGRAFFDLQNGVVLGPTNLVDSQIENIGNGWYRCTIVSSDTISDARIYVADNSQSFASSGSIYIQSAQLEIGLAATEVIKSGASTGKAGLLENEPRLDYSGGATCPSLLLEPSRTQLFEQSEYFGGWAANPSGISSIESNYAISPEGLQNAYKINFVVQSDSDLALVEGHSVTGGSTYAYSIYIKGEGSDIGKDIVIKSKRSGGDSAGTTTFQTLTGEWKRIDFTATYAANNTAANFYISSNDATSCLVYGAQAELGSYPTSYIPNHSGGSATRTADLTDRGANLSYTGNYTLFMEFNLTEDAAYILNATTLSTWSMYVEGSFAGFQFGRTGGDAGSVSFASSFDWSAAIGTNVKIALVKNGTSAAMFVNGTKYTPSANTLSTGNEVFDWRYLNYTTTTTRHKQNYINQLLEFEVALTDSECIALTTL
jgi:hypothetical protein